MGCFAPSRRTDVLRTCLPLLVITSFLIVPFLRTNLSNLLLFIAYYGNFTIWGIGSPSNDTTDPWVIATFVIAMGMFGIILLLVWRVRFVLLERVHSYCSH